MLSLDYTAADAGAEAALAAAGPARAILLGVEVEPSSAPASLVILHNGQPLLQKPLVCKTCMLAHLCYAAIWSRYGVCGATCFFLHLMLGAAPTTSAMDCHRVAADFTVRYAQGFLKQSC